MHTTDFEVPGYKRVWIHHNADWSGDVHVHWQTEDSAHECHLPGLLLLVMAGQVAYEHMRTQLIEVLEQLKRPATTAYKILQELRNG